VPPPTPLAVAAADCSRMTTAPRRICRPRARRRVPAVPTLSGVAQAPRTVASRDRLGIATNDGYEKHFISATVSMDIDQNSDLCLTFINGYLIGEMPILLSRGAS